MQDDDNTSSQSASQETATPEEATVDRRARMQKRRKFLLIMLTVLFLGIGLAYGVYWYRTLRYYVSTEDAYVHGNKIMLAPQISGTVVSVGVNNTDWVRAGQVVVKLDQSDARVALARAKANLAQTVRHVRQLYERVAMQKALIKKYQAQLAQARRDFHRNQNLLEINGVSRKEYQHSATALKAARFTLTAARHKLKALQSLTQGTDLRHNPQVRLAAAQLRKAYLNLKRTRILAPVTGYVAHSHVQVGQRVTPSRPIMAIVPLDQVWVQANFKETNLERMRIGQPVILHADFYGDEVTYHGKVVGISPGTGAAFELLPPQNATGNWIKIVRRVPVRIRLRPEEIKKHPLRLGLSMSVTVDMHDTSGAVLATTPSTNTAYTTDVYKERVAQVNELIQKIISANSGSSLNNGH